MTGRLLNLQRHCCAYRLALTAKHSFTLNVEILYMRFGCGCHPWCWCIHGMDLSTQQAAATPTPHV